MNEAAYSSYLLKIVCLTSTVCPVEAGDAYHGAYLAVASTRVQSIYGFNQPWLTKLLTHWGRVTHICVGKLAIIG